MGAVVGEGQGEQSKQQHNQLHDQISIKTHGDIHLYAPLPTLPRGAATTKALSARKGQI
jgi:hypothetical protein